MTTEAQSEMFAPPVQFVPDHAKPRLTGENYRDAALNAVEDAAPHAVPRITGEQYKRIGGEAALEAAGDWEAESALAIGYLASKGEPFCSEDVRELAGNPPSPGAMGGAFQRAAKAGLIRKQDWTKATRRIAHATDLRTWVGAS